MIREDDEFVFEELLLMLDGTLGILLVVIDDLEVVDELNLGAAVIPIDYINIKINYII